MNDVSVRHNGDVISNVIEGAFRVVEDFAIVDEQKRAMKMLALNPDEQVAFTRSALTLKYDD